MMAAGGLWEVRAGLTFFVRLYAQRQGAETYFFCQVSKFVKCMLGQWFCVGLQRPSENGFRRPFEFGRFLFIKRLNDMAQNGGGCFSL